jgi:hypothetical protein
MRYCIGQRKKLYDKRETEKKKTADREARQAIRNGDKGIDELKMQMVEDLNSRQDANFSQ